jgi:septal ring factor EnvC (AmiA/AmiB activator)
MAKYGLQRGIRGSEARHIATPQYYRDVYVKSEGLRADIAELEETIDTRQQEITELYYQEEQARTRTEQAAAEKQQAETELAGKQSELQKVRGELKTEKFKSSAAEAGTKFANTVGSLLGSSKIERQQQEIETLKAENYTLTMQVSNRDTQIRNLHRDHRSEIERLTQTHNRDMAAKQKEIDRIEFWFPNTQQMSQTADYCREVGFSEAQTVELIRLIPFSTLANSVRPRVGEATMPTV